jgi:hypothetical protein
MPDRVKRQADKNLLGKKLIVMVRVRKIRLPSPHRQHEKSGDDQLYTLGSEFGYWGPSIENE